MLINEGQQPEYQGGRRDINRTISEKKVEKREKKRRKEKEGGRGGELNEVARKQTVSP